MSKNEAILELIGELLDFSRESQGFEPLIYFPRNY